MDIFNNSISLPKMLEDGEQEMYDFRLQHTTINEELKQALWNPEKCLSIAFDRCWDIDRLAKFLIDNFTGIKYLQLLCSNYMLTEAGKSYDFKDFPKTITHLHIKCATHQPNVGFISTKYLEETSLQWLMLHGRVEEPEYKLPKMLTCFIRACKNNDDDKRMCLTPILLTSLEWKKTSDIRPRIPEFDFAGNRCGFMEVYKKIILDR